VRRDKYISGLPRGISLYNDIAEFLRNTRIDVIFDVGAHIGESTLYYARQFPDATIYSFEPVGKIFDKLSNAFAGSSRVRCFNTAVCDKIGYGLMRQRTIGQSTINCLDKCHDEVPNSVPITTIDAFCQEAGINSINFLKIDAEGNDLSVLTGANGMLGQQRIDLLQVEAGMNQDSGIFNSFEELKRFLEERDYLLFAIYEQIGEWPTNDIHLRRTNPVFISRKAIERNNCKRWESHSETRVVG
jgi:FkbM family methyltransferase